MKVASQSAHTFARPRELPHAAAFLRHTSTREWFGHSDRPGAAGPQRCRDDDDLFPSARLTGIWRLRSFPLDQVTNRVKTASTRLGQAAKPRPYAVRLQDSRVSGSIPGIGGGTAAATGARPPVATRRSHDVSRQLSGQTRQSEPANTPAREGTSPLVAHQNSSVRTARQSC